MAVRDPAPAAAVIEGEPNGISEGDQRALHGIGVGLLAGAFMRRARRGPTLWPEPDPSRQTTASPARTVTRTRATYEHACCRWGLRLRC
jgi:hypothetical protein